MFGKSLLSCNSGIIDLTQGQVAHYLLNNNADDNYGTYDGTPSGGVDFQGDMTKFDGIDGVINFDSTADFINGDFVLSLWITPTDFTRQRIFYSGYYTNATSANIILIDINHTTNGDIAIMLNTEAVTVTSTNIINNLYSTLNEKFNLVIKRVSSTYYVYKNATLIGSFTGIVPTDNTATRIGSSNPPSCYVSNFRVYGEDKNQTFIDALYAEGYYPKPLTLPTTEGLIAHYPLTGTAEDTTGNYDGVESGVTYVDDAEFGSVSHYSGFNEGISFVGDTRFQGVTVFSGCFWIKTTGSTSDIISQWSSTVSNTVFILQMESDGTIRTLFRDSDGSTLYTNALNTTVVNDGNWHFVYFHFNGGECTINIDFVNTTNGTNVGAITRTTALDLWFGRRADGSNDFVGDLKDIHFFNRTLTTQEITDIYNYEKNFRPIDIDDGLVAFYPLANNSLDNYKNQYDGVDTSMTYDGLSCHTDGTSSYVNLNTVQDLVFPYTVSEWTVNVWCRAVDYANRNGFYMSATKSASYYIGAISISCSSSLGASDGHAGITFYETSTYTARRLYNLDIEPDEWHMFTVQRKAGNIYVSIDGSPLTLVGSAYSSGYSSYEAAYEGIGIYGFSSPNYYACNAAKLRFYNKTVSDEQVAAIYNTEKGEFGL